VETFVYHDLTHNFVRYEMNKTKCWCFFWLINGVASASNWNNRKIP